MALSKFNRTVNAADLIRLVGIEVGLPSIADPFVSADPQYQRMITLLNVAGNNLIDMFSWCRLQTEYSFTTVIDQSDYDLPADFNALIPNTLWQRTSMLVGYGSASPQMWQYQAGPVILSAIFRERSNLISLMPTPSSAVDITFEYESRGWVSATGPSGPFRDNVETAADVVLLDPALTSRYLKMKFLEAVGFDTQKATDDFNLVLDARTSKDISSPTLNITQRANPIRFIDVANLPDTGYGS